MVRNALHSREIRWIVLPLLGFLTLFFRDFTGSMPVCLAKGQPAIGQTGVEQTDRELAEEAVIAWYGANAPVPEGCGAISYEDLDVNVYPLEDIDGFLAMVVYELATERYEERLPGYETKLLRRQKDGGWAIAENEALNEALTETPALYGEIEEILDSEEETERLTDVNERYSKILEENPTITAWLAQLQDVVSKKQIGSYDGSEADTSEKEGADLYTVQKGDCLWDIAEREYGRGFYWPELYEKNKGAIGDDPDLIYEGTELQL